MKSELKVKQKGSLFIAKLIAGLACVCVLFLVSVEVFTFASYVLPLWLTLMAQLVNVKEGTDWVIGMILWGFPALFITVFSVLVHFYGLRHLLKVLFRWVVRVFRQKE